MLYRITCCILLMSIHHVPTWRCEQLKLPALAQFLCSREHFFHCHLSRQNPLIGSLVPVRGTIIGDIIIIIIVIINLDRIAASTRSVGLHAGPQHIRTNKITKQI